MPKEYLTVEEVAELLGVSTVTVYKMAATGKLQKAKVGGKVLFRKADFRNPQAAKAAKSSAPKKDKKVLDWWMIPRSTRKLTILQQMIKEDHANGIIGGKWKGTRSSHRRRDKLSQESGLRGSSLEGFMDKDPGGARTDVALLVALGFYAYEADGSIELTYQGEAMLESETPAAIITDQLFQFRYPSPYSVAIHMNEEIQLMPHRFLFELLMQEELADDGSVLEDDGVVRLTQKEIAEFVVAKAKRQKDLKKAVAAIVASRKIKAKLTPDERLNNIANTFINNIEVTGYITRFKGALWIKDDESNIEVARRLTLEPRSFKYELGDERNFQRRLGADPSKKRFTASLRSNRSAADDAIRSLLEEFLSHNPGLDEVTPELIQELASAVGVDEEKAGAVVRASLRKKPKELFAKAFLTYAQSGRTYARKFELSTTELMKKLCSSADWTGKEGRSPDVKLSLAGKAGIIDCKAEQRYNITNDHFNRMTVEDGYIDRYEADFFLYVAHSFGGTFPANLQRVQTKSRIKGAGITAEDLLYLFEQHREEPFTSKQLLKLFTCGSVINVQAINTVRTVSK